MVYLDDIVVLLGTPEEHIDNVRRVLSLYHEADITLQLKKGKLFKNFIDYLSHVIKP